MVYGNSCCVPFDSNTRSLHASGSPEEAALDYVPNPRAGALYLVRFAAPEFTSET